MVGVLPIWIVQSNVSSIGPSSERKPLRRRANARNVRLNYPYWQYTDFDLYLYSSCAAHYTYNI